MKKDLILIGGGGHCASCIDVIESGSEYQILGILDTPANLGNQILNHTIIGTDDDIKKYILQGCYFLLTVGQIESASLRIKLSNAVTQNNGKLATVISKRAYVADSALIGAGTIVMHDALVNVNAKVGENCIINTKALIEHDSEIGSHCHVSTGAILNGGVKLGNECFVGSGAVVVHGATGADALFIKANSMYKRSNK